MADIERFLKDRRDAGLLRTLHPINSRKNGRITVEGKKYIDFSSNDYLALSQHPVMVRDAYQAMDKFGTGVGAARLLSGSLALHHRLEEKVAAFKGCAAALVMNSGYQANIGVISALVTKGDVIFSDRYNHASIVDGMLLSGARIIRFRHNSMTHLRQVLQANRKKFKKAMIITETVFSMDGDRPPLPEIVALKEEFDCLLMVDEAHATGIYGSTGAGMVEEAGVTDKVDVNLGTFSKGLGSFGAYVAGSARLITYLVNACRSFIYSTALPAPVIAANLAALDLVRKEKFRREELLQMTGEFRCELKEMGFNLKGDTQIVPVVIGDIISTVRLSELLRRKGFWVMPIREPTVPKNQARLRFSLTAYHRPADIRKLLKVLSEV